MVHKIPDSLKWTVPGITQVAWANRPTVFQLRRFLVCSRTSGCEVTMLPFSQNDVGTSYEQLGQAQYDMEKLLFSRFYRMNLRTNAHRRMGDGE